MRYFERVTVALCLEPVDVDLLLYARLVNHMRDGDVQFSFVHVLPAADGWSREDRPPSSVAEVRAAMLAAVTEHFGEVTSADIEVLSGALIDRLLETVAEDESDLLMVGHRRGARGRRSTSRRLAMKAPCSVWMVPEGAPPQISNVLAAADFSQPSAHAVSLATLIARRAGNTSCAALHVLHPRALGFDAADTRDVWRSFDRFLAPLDLHSVQVRQLVSEDGSVAGAAARNVANDGVDLLVLGTRGLGVSAAVLLGSESEGALLDSTVPVLVTKDRGDRLGVLRALLDRDFESRDPQFS